MTIKDTAIILMNPQLGENIGAAARVMKNFGYSDLRIVNPKCEWPSDKAFSMSAGAKDMVEAIKVYDNLADAVVGVEYLFAATVRPRDMFKKAIVSQEVGQSYPAGRKIGVLFGGERCGLSNDELAIADTIVTVVTSKEYGSLNLAQSIALICYELQRETTIATELTENFKPAPKDELFGMLSMLENALDASNYFRSADKRDAMVDTLTSMFSKTGWTDQEVRTFRGVIRSLSKY